MSELYYTTPSEEVFENIKENCIKLWRTYDDEFGYASGKVERVEGIQNVKDNYMYMVGMFDSTNEGILYWMVSDEVRQLFDKLRSEGSILYPVQSPEMLMLEMNGPDDKRAEILEEIITQQSK